MEEPRTDDPSAPDRTAEARAEELVGRIISQRYRVDALLALGGMGAVYLGRHQHLKKRVAIKILHPDTENLPELVTRFEREAIAGAHIVHPNVAAATDFGQLDDGSYFLVLEYVSGKTLHEVIQQGPLPTARAVAIAVQLAEALAAVHAMGIVHRDLKPRNVMLVEAEGKEDRAKLIDFGLAKVPIERVVSLHSIRPPPAMTPEGVRPQRMRLDSLLEDRPRLTGVGMIVGTVGYLAPEASLGMDAVDARADLYALGLILYQMLAGKHPFDAEQDAAMFAHQRFTKPPPFAERAPGIVVPLGLEAIVMALLEKDPAARPASASHVIDALDAAMAAPPPRAPSPRSWRDHIPVVIAVGAVVFGVAAALAFNASSAGPRLATQASSSATAAAPPPTHQARAHAPEPSSPSASSVVAAVEPTASASSTLPDARGPGPRSMLLHALRVRDLRTAEAAFLELTEREPDSFREPELALAARELAVGLEREQKADRLFETLTTGMGSAGLDVLYDLVATRGRSGVALRAATLLRRNGVLARATPELRVAFELREAPCAAKLGLFDRAVAEGDARALIVLETQGVACFKKHNRPLQEAMAALRARLRR